MLIEIRSRNSHWPYYLQEIYTWIKIFLKIPYELHVWIGIDIEIKLDDVQTRESYRCVVFTRTNFFYLKNLNK